MKKKSSIILHSLFFVICSVLAVLCLYHIISIRRLNVKYTPAMTEESSRELDNPYRGFYQLSGYILSDNQKPEKSADWCRKSCASNPYPLMLLEINLKNYSNTSISTNAQNQLDKILEECVRAKKQVILRFLYDWDGQALSTEPSGPASDKESYFPDFFYCQQICRLCLYSSGYSDRKYWRNESFQLRRY